MKTFTDNAGRSWSIAINVNAIKRVRDLLDVDLASTVDGDEQSKKLLAQLMVDPILVCDVVYCVCKPEADKLGITDEDFGRAMAGDAIGQAREALLAELVNFSPSPDQRRVAQKAINKLKLMESKAMAHVEKQIDDPRIDQLIDDHLSELTSSFSGLPGLSASIPESSHSEN